jgi:hypothetical protein
LQRVRFPANAKIVLHSGERARLLKLNGISHSDDDGNDDDDIANNELIARYRGLSNNNDKNNDR